MLGLPEDFKLDASLPATGGPARIIKRTAKKQVLKFYNYQLRYTDNAFAWAFIDPDIPRSVINSDI